MRIEATLLLAAIAFGSAKAILSPSPTARQDPVPETELPPLLRLRKEREKFLSEGVMGCWQLEEFTVNGLTAPADEITGSALFFESYMALVIHALGFDAVTSEGTLVVQAGIFRYRVDEFGALQTSTVIGHSNPLGDVQHDAEGELREYTLDLDQSFLTLRHQDGTALRFSKMQESAFSAGEIIRLAQVPTPSSETLEESADVPDDSSATSGDLEPLLEFRRAQKESAEQGLQGSWQLQDYVRNGVATPEGEITARALFWDGYSALVIHARGFDELTAEELFLAQAGLFRYRVDEGLELQTSTIIGHSNLLGLVEWEAPGELREYSITFEKAEESRFDLLTLRHETGTTMRFGRTGTGEITQREIDRLNEMRGIGFDTSPEQER